MGEEKSDLAWKNSGADIKEGGVAKRIKEDPPERYP